MVDKADKMCGYNGDFVRVGKIKLEIEQCIGFDPCNLNLVPEKRRWWWFL